MANQDLSDNIWNDAGFREDYASLRISASARTLKDSIDISLDVGMVENWFHMLRCAAILIESSSEEHHDAALRIIYSALQLSDDENVKGYAIALLLKTANKPSIKLAVDRAFVPENVIDQLPTLLQIEARAGEIASTISYETEREFVGNLFQKTLWGSLENNQWVSASAPTSAGKSFLLEKWIERIIYKQDSSTTFYIVPTRALISQVERDIRALLSKYKTHSLNVTSLPLHFMADKNHNVFIYTQERFHLYLLSGDIPDSADLIILDEAHKIGDDTRGILLQQVLEMATKKFSQAKFLFASPSTENPESLLIFAPRGASVSSVTGSTPTVNQNLYWVSQKFRKPKEWNIQYLLDGEPSVVGEITLPDKPKVSQKLPFIAMELDGGDGGNVLYVNGAADAENAAEMIYQSRKTEEPPDAELVALSDFCEKTVHPEFLLRKYLLRGVAFHYGNIPQLVREEIERLFSIGKIEYLICTSTLIEGVNLACKSIFLRHPKRGQSELMRPDDFWNLAGRAGRWGKEFQGNIFCIDPLKEAQWFGGQAPRQKKKHKIVLATASAANKFKVFIDYVESEKIKVTSSNPLFDQLLSYLVFRRSEFEDIGAANIFPNLQDTEKNELESTIDGVIDSLIVPVDIVNRNPGISPFGMQALLNYFKSKDANEIEDLLPADPLSDGAPDSFVGIFSRITKYLGSPSLGSGGFAFGNALLVVHWMQGWPLARLINGQIDYDIKSVDKKNAKREKMSDEERAETKIPKLKTKRAIIRETMGNVEKIARYEAPKYLHCYLDVLNHFLIEIDRSDLKEEISDIWMFLEFGVSKKTELSLISLGISRSSVMAVSDKIKASELDEQQVYDWLSTNEWREFGLSELVTMEIERCLARRSDLAPETDVVTNT